MVLTQAIQALYHPAHQQAGVALSDLEESMQLDGVQHAAGRLVQEGDW